MPNPPTPDTIPAPPEAADWMVARSGVRSMSCHWALGANVAGG
ncbi:hypothetical protein ACWCOV_32450 [Kribbella sp. NPDC002412]